MYTKSKYLYKNSKLRDKPNKNALFIKSKVNSIVMKHVIFLILVLALLFVGTSAFITNPPGIPAGPTDEGVKAFSSVGEFKSYLEESASFGSFYSSLGRGGWDNQMMAMETADGAMPAPASNLGKSGGDERVSGTNVQVMGIDEPDIVKTDGESIFFSRESYYRYFAEDIDSGAYTGPETKIINAFPPDELEVAGKIEDTGNMLLSGDSLILFPYYDNIKGYDVSDPDSPEKAWTLELNGSYVDARLYQGKVYLITMDSINHYRPCPIIPLRKDGREVVITCENVFHPVSPIDADVTYTAMIIDPETGDVEKAVSFVGSSSSSIVYMSENAIYVTYSYPGDMLGIMIDFFKEEASELIPGEITDRLEEIDSYDISYQSKMTEFTIVMERFLSGLSYNERLELENEITNRMSDYAEEHKREFTKTGIARMDLNLKMKASGVVPGQLLNQFSMDEYEGNLRVAITIDNFRGFSGWTSTESANDVYILDENMVTVGSIKDLGVTERIYSVRFIQDKGYVVTFRQIDPFYVLDLSDPADPEMKGELKIPGYSSYLHPVGEDLILGIGKEGSKVKISLFDVSDVTDPTEADKYILTDYWSDILNTHHAFLHDSKHEVFFMPGSKGGYIFSYEGESLNMEKAVGEISAKRALYIDDYMYIIGDDKIVVLEENTWETEEELEL